METGVAATLRDILDNPLVEAAMDRSKPIKPTIKKALEAWQVDLDKRNPAPIYTEGIDGEPVYKGTDFDLFTLMMALAERRAVINIPSYDTLTATRLTSNQRVVSKENRHGQVLRLVSNEDANSFSVLIKDYNVIETMPNGKEKVGMPRNFAMVDYYGNWHEEWGHEFKAIKKERDFFEEHGIKTLEGTLRFQNFVHPLLAFAFSGSRYYAMKAIDQRMKEMSRHYRGIADKLRKMGIKLPPPPSATEEYKKPAYKTLEPTKQIEVTTIQAKLVLPPFKGVYPLYSLSEDRKIKEYSPFHKLPEDKKALQWILRYCEAVADELSYGIGASVRAPIRAVELAFFLNGFKKEHNLEPGYEKTPGWDIPPWIRDYHENLGKRKSPIEWNALKLNDYVRFLYRVRKASVDVKQDLGLDENIRRYEGAEAVLV